MANDITPDTPRDTAPETEAQIRARFIDSHGVTPEQHLYALDPSKPLLTAGDDLGFIMATHHDRQRMIHGTLISMPKGMGDVDVFALAMHAYIRLTAEEHAALTALDALASPANFDPLDDYFLDRVWIIERMMAPQRTPRPHRGDR